MVSDAGIATPFEESEFSAALFVWMLFASIPLIMKLLNTIRAPLVEMFCVPRPSAAVSGTLTDVPVDSPRIWVKLRVSSDSAFLLLVIL